MYSKNEIAEILGIDRKTLGNWEKNRPELYKIVSDHFEKKAVAPDYNNKEYLKQEISDAMDRLPISKAKRFYHLIMAELTEFE